MSVKVGVGTLSMFLEEADILYLQEYFKIFCLSGLWGSACVFSAWYQANFPLGQGGRSVKLTTELSFHVLLENA